jgi:hypothetical protein
MLFVDGLPFKERQVREYEAAFDTKGFVNQAKMRVILEPWSCEMDLPLVPERAVFNKVYCIENRDGVNILRGEIPDMQNDIHEADNAVFFFSRFFPDVRTQMAYINDGDAISIGMLRALEDFKGPDNFQHEQWLCLPYKSKKKKALFVGKAPELQYINLTKLCQKVEATPEFVEAGVQSPVATLIFLIVLSETDFFKGEFCFGIGGKTIPHADKDKREKQTKGIWDTFFADLPMYSHMVQYYPIDKSVEVERRIVIDEELFELFTQQCYLNKYGAAAAKKLKKDSSTFDLVKLHCAKSVKDKRKHPPEPVVNQRWARQIAWNLNYWANAFRNIYIDPFERYNGRSYWGYEDNTITNVIAAKQKPLDEVYKRNFWKRRQKPGEMPVEPIADKKKQAALDLIRGKH